MQTISLKLNEMVCMFAIVCNFKKDTKSILWKMVPNGRVWLRRPCVCVWYKTVSNGLLQYCFGTVFVWFKTAIKRLYTVANGHEQLRTVWYG